MDLDNIKKVWQENNAKPDIKEHKIQQMLDNKGKGAFENLIKYEKLGLILAIICIPISFVFRETCLIVFYLCSILLAFLWQIYKYRSLKKIDFVKMGILEISTNITKYKKYLYCELIVGFIWAIIFCSVWMYQVIYKDISKEFLQKDYSMLIIIGLFIVFVSIICLVTYILYRTIYISNIHTLEQSIKEIKDFEKDNNK